MKTPKTLADIENLINNQIEESTELEYKSSIKTNNPKWKEELAKDISAMANANGGVIIYGIREKDGENGLSIPKEITAIPTNEMSKDSLTQIINANIQPKIEDIEITTIQYENEGNIFVVEIPQSNTAHQNKITKLYYKRRNATIEAMEDYEIRDIMNRSKFPLISLSVEIEKYSYYKTEQIQIPPTYEYPLPRTENREIKYTRYKMNIVLENKGSVLAQYINYFVDTPEDIISDIDYYDVEDGMATIQGSNTVRDLLDYQVHPMGYNKELYGPSRYDPILPHLIKTAKTIELTDDPNLDDRKIRWSVFADNAPEQTGEIVLSSIPIINKD